MKRIFFYTLSLAMVLLVSSCGPTVQEAIDYNDKIIDQELAVIDKIDALETEFSTYDPETIEPAWNEALNQLNTSISELEKMGAFDGSTEFKDQTLEFFKMFKNQVEVDYAEMLKIYKLPSDDYTEVEENRYNEILDKIDDEYQAGFKKFTETQEKFAAKYNFELTEDGE